MQPGLFDCKVVTQSPVQDNMLIREIDLFNNPPGVTGSSEPETLGCPYILAHMYLSRLESATIGQNYDCLSKVPLFVFTRLATWSNLVR